MRLDRFWITTACAVVLLGWTMAGEVAAQSERSPVLSGALELFVPTAGFGYAGDWRRGVLPNVIRIGSLAGLLVSDVCESDNGNDGACAALAATLAISNIWAIVGAVNTARDRNRAVGATSPGLALFPGPSTGSFSIGLALPR